jgi:hypothetical protein
MSAEIDLSWVRGETAEWTLTVTDSTGALVDLSSILAAEFEVKVNFGDPDPALLHLDLVAGITILDQTTKTGQLFISATTTQTLSLSQAVYAYDVFITRADGGRKRVAWGDLTISDTVNESP